LVRRKIVQINEELCNGCGNCIPECAEGALQIQDCKAKIIKETYCDGLGACLGHCPQGAITIVEKEAESFNQKEAEEHLAQKEAQTKKKNELRQWPIKLNLVPIQAPFYENSNLLIAADCAPVAFVDLHNKLLPGKRILIGCTKFDDAKAYAEKLGEIFTRNNIASVTVAHMEVPCCSGLNWVVNKALQISGKNIPVKQYIISIGGEVNEL
jgi:NAD-dependent dihydropyrimidine dehydrogenase PreA subunit